MKLRRAELLIILGGIISVVLPIIIGYLFEKFLDSLPYILLLVLNYIIIIMAISNILIVVYFSCILFGIRIGHIKWRDD
jgi:hypothetical protein